MADTPTPDKSDPQTPAALQKLGLTSAPLRFRPPPIDKRAELLRLGFHRDLLTSVPRVTALRLQRSQEGGPDSTLGRREEQVDAGEAQNLMSRMKRSVL